MARSSSRERARIASKAGKVWDDVVTEGEGAKLEASDATPPQLLVDESESQNLLSQAQNSLERKDHVSAVRIAQKVTRTWPKSEAAKAARILLRELRDNEPMREWLSKDKKHKLVARFVREEGDQVLLSDSNSKVIRILLKNLSTNDQLYVIMRRKRL